MKFKVPKNFVPVPFRTEGLVGNFNTTIGNTQKQLLICNGRIPLFTRNIQLYRTFITNCYKDPFVKIQ